MQNKLKIKHGIIAVLLCIALPLTVSAIPAYEEIKNFENQFICFNETNNYWEYTTNPHRGNYSVRLLQAEYPEGLFLKISSVEKINVFINERVTAGNNDYFFNLDSLFKIHGSTELMFTFPNTRLNDISISLLQPFDVVFTKIEGPVLREEEGFSEFVMIVFLGIMGLWALFKNLFTQDFKNFFQWYNTFSFSHKEENLFKVKLASTSSLLVISLLILIISFSITIVKYKYGFPREPLQVYFYFFIRIIAFVSVFLLIKILVIRFFCYLFKLRRFFVSHFYNYLRITLLASIAFALILCTLYWLGIENINTIWLANACYFIVVLRSFIIFFKLIHAGDYRISYLFSYICGTEVIPFFIIYQSGI